MDLRKNRVAIGAVVFVLLLGLTLWAVNRRNRPAAGPVELPRIELDRDAITALEIRRPQGEPVVLSKVGEAWRVTEPLDAPADQSNAETAINRLAELRIARVVADRPENYQRLQVDDANAVQVTVKTGDEVLTELRVGKYANGMTMLRLADREEVFGATGSLRYAFDRELKAWRDRQVVAVDPAAVQSIRFESGAGVFQFDKRDTDWALVEGEEALGVLDPKKVSSLVSTAARLTASDFASEDTSSARAGLNEPSGKVTITVEDPQAPVVLELGANTENGSELYLRREGNPTIYVISTYLADRLQPDASAFEPSPEPSPGAAPTPAPSGQGTPQLPPEIMRQLQEQIRAQQEQQR